MLAWVHEVNRESIGQSFSVLGGIVLNCLLDVD